MSRRVAIITGPIMSGKSTLAQRVINELHRRGLAVGGILARSLWNGDDRYGFDLVDLADGSVTPLARKQPAAEAAYPVPFDFFEAGMAAGRAALVPQKCAACHAVLLDEVGKLELMGQGWAPQISPLLDLEQTFIMLIVRNYLVDQVINFWSLDNPAIVNAAQEGAFNTLLDLILTGEKINAD